MSKPVLIRTVCRHRRAVRSDDRAVRPIHIASDKATERTGFAAIDQEYFHHENVKTNARTASNHIGKHESQVEIREQSPDFVALRRIQSLGTAIDSTPGLAFSPGPVGPEEYPLPDP
jgi:hypothetical protein